MTIHASVNAPAYITLSSNVVSIIVPRFYIRMPGPHYRTVATSCRLIDYTIVVFISIAYNIFKQ